MKKLTDEKIKKLKTLHANLASSKWMIKRDSIYSGKTLICNMSDIWPVQQNRYLIVDAVNELPAMIAEIETLRGRND